MSEYASWGFEEGEELQPGRAVLKTIGGGNRYEVCLVWDESLYALAVAKVLRPDQAEDEKALRDLRLEVEALGALAHPTLVRSFDAVLDGPHPHVLIEHLDGPSLRRLIKRDGAIPLQQLLPLAAHVSGALQYMAQSGYVHLDVKPDNIVMGLPPRLIDLSIARTLERAERTRGPPANVPAELAALLLELLDRDQAARPSCAEAVERLQPLVAAQPQRLKLGRRGPVGA